MKVEFHGVMGVAWKSIWQENPHQTFTISHGSMCNTTNANTWFSLCLVAPGEQPGTNNAHYWQQVVAGNSTVEHPAGLVIPYGYGLYCQNQKDSAMSYSFSGDHV